MTDSETPPSEESFEELRARAEAGDVNAQTAVGDAYLNGRDGCAKDPGEAARWIGLAADQGKEAAQFNFGMMHYTGLGVPKNLVTAYMWFTLGSGWLDGEFDQREWVGRNMTAEQIAEAERLAEEWRAAHPRD